MGTDRQLAGIIGMQLYVIVNAMVCIHGFQFSRKKFNNACRPPCPGDLQTAVAVEPPPVITVPVTIVPVPTMPVSVLGSSVIVETIDPVAVVGSEGPDVIVTTPVEVAVAEVDVLRRARSGSRTNGNSQ